MKVLNNSFIPLSEKENKTANDSYQTKVGNAAFAKDPKKVIIHDSVSGICKLDSKFYLLENNPLVPDAQKIPAIKAMEIARQNLKEICKNDNNVTTVQQIFKDLAEIEERKYAHGFRGKLSQLVSCVKNALRGNSFHSTAHIINEFATTQLVKESDLTKIQKDIKTKIKNAIGSKPGAENNANRLFSAIITKVAPIEWTQLKDVYKLTLQGPLKITIDFNRKKINGKLVKTTELKFSDNDGKKVVEFVKGGIKVFGFHLKKMVFNDDGVQLIGPFSKELAYLDIDTVLDMIKKSTPA